MIFKLLLLLVLSVVRAQAFWQLKWSDEFDNTSIDLSKWDVTNEEVSCDGNHIQQLNCKTNNSRNIWLLEGTLSIAALRETQKYLNRDFTSAMITTKEGFTFGKFEIRAALPNGKMLRPAMYFIPTVKTGGWPADGQIDLMTNIQTQSLASGFHSVRGYAGEEYKAPPQLNLNHFHSYILEWNQTTIIWKLDEIQRLSINLTKYFANIDNPFINPFKIVMTLGVGGQFFSGQDSLSEDDISDWPCSLLVLDYIRIYDWIEANKEIEEKHFNGNESEIIGPDSICNAIMPLIRLKKKVNIPFTTIISVLSLILLLAIIPFVVYLFNRQKKLKLNQRNSDHEYYEDTQAEEAFKSDYYEDIKDNEYADPYAIPLQNTNHYTNESTTEGIQKDAEDYTPITNKYV